MKIPLFVECGLRPRESTALVQRFEEGLRMSVAGRATVSHAEVVVAATPALACLPHATHTEAPRDAQASSTHVTDAHLLLGMHQEPETSRAPDTTPGLPDSVPMAASDMERIATMLFQVNKELRWLFEFDKMRSFDLELDYYSKQTQRKWTKFSEQRTNAQYKVIENPRHNFTAFLHATAIGMVLLKEGVEELLKVVLRQAPFRNVPRPEETDTPDSLLCTLLRAIQVLAEDLDAVARRRFAVNLPPERHAEVTRLTRLQDLVINAYDSSVQPQVRLTENACNCSISIPMFP
jgi:hypothetical protein